MCNYFLVFPCFRAGLLLFGEEECMKIIKFMKKPLNSYILFLETAV